MEMNVCLVMCPDCGKDFKSMGPLKAHIKEVHEYENVMCGECGKGFKNQARLKIHERLVHIRVDKVEYCDQCEKVFKNKGEVFHHRNAVHTIEPITCCICDCSSKNQYAFRKHFKKCSKKNPCVRHNLLPCNFCLKTYSSGEDLNLQKNCNNPNKDVEKDLESEIAVKNHTKNDIQMPFEENKSNASLEKKNDENMVDSEEENSLEKNPSDVLANVAANEEMVQVVKLEKQLYVETNIFQTTVNTAYDTSEKNMDENLMDIEKELAVIYSNENDIHMPVKDADKNATKELTTKPQKTPSDLLVNVIKEMPPIVKYDKKQIENEIDCIENSIFKAFNRLEKKLDDNFMDTEEFEFESLELHQPHEDSCSISLKDNTFVKDETSSIDLPVHNPSNKDDIEKTVRKTITRKRYTPGSLVCEMCAKSFSNQTSLNQHVRNVHSSDRKFPVVCQVCSKEYNMFTIKQHSKIHTEDKSECDFCKQMYSKGNLLAHMRRVHSKRESEIVICEICCKDYSEKSIKSHVENIHGITGHFQCDICKKEFKTRDYLSNHKHYVHSNKTYPCEACGNTFANKQYLARHFKTVHATGENACSCETCGKTFLHQNFLKHHIKAVHVLETMECEYCKKTYKNNYLLRKHVRKYHDE